MIREVEKRGLEFGWDPSHCPAVFTGPETAGAHYRPTDRKVERGHVLNIDLSKISGLHFRPSADILCAGGRENRRAEVVKGFDTIVTSIEMARQALKPGVQGVQVDRLAREYIVSRGYDEYPHALGHQVGRFAHDGTALLGPSWEKYAGRPFEPVEEGMVFTIEPRLRVHGRGVVTIEEMVIVNKDSASFLSQPQTNLILVE